MARPSNPDTSFKFDEAGNVITIRPEKVEEVKVVWTCQFDGSEWKSKISRDRHESWCKENPNRRTSYRKPETEVKKPKNPKKKTPVKTKTLKSVIKELKAFDKVFGLTDEQIAKYMRGLMK